MGRDTELAAIAALVDRARGGRSGALLVTGEPGIGKTALLECAAESATGLSTRWTVGTENETAIGHAGLLTLLSPLRDRLDRLPGPQAAALGHALGWTDAGGPPSPLLVAGATVAMLSADAAERPVLVVVDDAHWLDHESATALFFAIRRMRDDPIAFMIGTREPPPGQDR